MIRFTIEAKGMVELRAKLKKCAEEICQVTLNDETMAVGLIVDKPVEDVEIKPPGPSPEKVTEEVKLGQSLYPIEEVEQKSIMSWPRTNSQGQLVDVTQTVWDKEIHSSNKKCSKDGRWMRRRGTGPNSKKSKELENHAPVSPPVVTQPVVETPKGPPIIEEIAEKVNEAPVEPVEKEGSFDAEELMSKPMDVPVFKDNLQDIVMTLSAQDSSWPVFFETWFKKRGIAGVWELQQNEELTKELYDALVKHGTIIKG